MLQCTIPPLNQRIFHSGCTCSGPRHQDTLQRPSKLKQWSTEAMDKAIIAVLNEGMSIYVQLSIMQPQSQLWEMELVVECFQAPLVD